MGHVLAHRELARCYYSGFGTEKDKQRAFHWWKKAVELGDKGSIFTLALCYSRGIGVRLNYARAIELFKRAAELGNKRAASEIVTLYEKKMRKLTRSVYSHAMRLIHMKKFDEAFSLLLRSEDLGYPKAIYTIGVMYEFGLGTRRDKNSAVSYYEKASRDNERYRGFRDPSAGYKSRILKIIK